MLVTGTHGTIMVDLLLNDYTGTMVECLGPYDYVYTSK